MQQTAIRLLVDLLAYIVAALVATPIVLLLLGIELADFPLYLTAGVLMVLIFAFLPFALALYLLHRLGRTGWLSHALAGAAVGIVAQLVMTPGLVLRPMALLQSWPLAVGGAVAGVVYWAVATALKRRLLSGS